MNSFPAGTTKGLHRVDCDMPHGNQMREDSVMQRTTPLQFLKTTTLRSISETKSLSGQLTSPQTPIPITPHCHVNMGPKHLCSRHYPCPIMCQEPCQGCCNVEVNCRQVPAPQAIHLFLSSSKATPVRVPCLRLCKLVCQIAVISRREFAFNALC